jgi:predicted glycosyltransferase involved in capsule biosynthesis
LCKSLHRIKKYITLAKEINKLKHKTMKTFEINKITRITNNTAEYGFGDYTDKKYEVVAIIKADNIRKAQSIYKREYDKSAKFNRWSNHYVIER